MFLSIGQETSFSDFSLKEHYIILINNDLRMQKCQINISMNYLKLIILYINSLIYQFDCIGN